jgi:hypothetical protein
MKTRIATATLLAGALALGTAASALASHQHVRVLGNGECVIIGAGGESAVNLPDAVFDANPNVVPGTYAENRQHPLHVLVHIGGAGNGMVYVYGSAQDLETCAGHVNG